MVLETGMTADGITRLRMHKGWISLASKTGAELVEIVSSLPREEAPTAISDEQLVATLPTGEQSSNFPPAPLGKRHRCVAKTIVRVAADMASDKTGILAKGTEIIVLEETTHAGAIACAAS